MVQPDILEKLDKLPAPLQTEVLHYIEFLLERYAKTLPENQPDQPDQPKKRRAGILKGTFVLPLVEDFDEPLEDMKEYME